MATSLHITNVQIIYGGMIEEYTLNNGDVLLYREDEDTIGSWYDPQNDSPVDDENVHELYQKLRFWFIRNVVLR
jgi:hypothetical protein